MVELLREVAHSLLAASACAVSSVAPSMPAVHAKRATDGRKRRRKVEKGRYGRRGRWRRTLQVVVLLGLCRMGGKGLFPATTRSGDQTNIKIERFDAETDT